MEAIDHLKSVVEKFNTAKAENLPYPTYKDRALSEAVAEAEQFINGAEKQPEEVAQTAPEVTAPEAEQDLAPNPTEEVKPE